MPVIPRNVIFIVLFLVSIQMVTGLSFTLRLRQSNIVIFDLFLAFLVKSSLVIKQETNINSGAVRKEF